MYMAVKSLYIPPVNTVPHGSQITVHSTVNAVPHGSQIEGLSKRGRAWSSAKNPAERCAEERLLKKQLKRLFKKDCWRKTCQRKTAQEGLLKNDR